MKTIFQCRIRTLSPVHVGSGKDYLRGADFDLQRNLITVFDSHQLQRDIEKAGAKVQQRYLEELQKERSNLFDFFRAVGWKSSDYRRYELPVDNGSIREIKAQIKDGFGQPIIPGSSLKGSLRTALLHHLIEQEADSQRIQNILQRFQGMNTRNIRHPSDEIERYLFGSDPQKNWLRVLQVPDVLFEREQLQLFQAKILSKTQNGYGFKKLGREKQNLPEKDVKWATSIVLEALNSNSQSQPFEIALDGFLLSHQRFQPTPFAFPEGRSFWEIVKNHFRRLAESEQQFFSEIGYREAANFYRDVILKERGQNEVLMRLSWGSGWHFMTGDWLTPAQKSLVRKLFGLGKRNVDEFPKTRRLAVENGKPYVPLGWVLLQVEEMDG